MTNLRMKRNSIMIMLLCYFDRRAITYYRSFRFPVSLQPTPGENCALLPYEHGAIEVVRRQGGTAAPAISRVTTWSLKVSGMAPAASGRKVNSTTAAFPPAQVFGRGSISATPRLPVAAAFAFTLNVAPAARHHLRAEEFQAFRVEVHAEAQRVFVTQRIERHAHGAGFPAGE